MRTLRERQRVTLEGDLDVPRAGGGNVDGARDIDAIQFKMGYRRIGGAIRDPERGLVGPRGLDIHVVGEPFAVGGEPYRKAFARDVLDIDIIIARACASGVAYRRVMVAYTFTA
jgi:hypothetical protein